MLIVYRWHHDIKPTNILIMSRKGGSTYDGRFLIADFGLSHFRQSEVLDQDKDNISRHAPSYGTSSFRSKSILLLTILQAPLNYVNATPAMKSINMAGKIA